MKAPSAKPQASPAAPGRAIEAATNRAEPSRRPKARRVTPVEVPVEAAGEARPQLGQGEIVPALLARLESEFGADRVHRYFDLQASLELRGTQLIVTVQTQMLVGLVERIFGKALREAAGDLIRDAATTIEYVIDPEMFPEQLDPDLVPAPRAQAKPSRTLARPKGKSEAFDERCDLARFVVGESNELAYEAALALADLKKTPASTRFFLHSDCGLGKTHLLRGIVRRVLAENPQARVRYISAEAFTNEYIASVQASSVEAFRKRYRSLDLLCLDDIHFLAHKTATQKELLYTLDEIDLGGARLVMASDGHPAAIEELSKALVNRMLSGLVVQIHTPEPALRRRLIAELCTRRGMRLEEPAVQRLAADPAKGAWTVRELEGQLTRIAAAAGVMGERLESGAVPMSVVERALSSQGRGGSPTRAIRFDHIRESVCASLEVEHKDLGESGRHPRVVLARALITMLCKQLTTLSYPEIARKLGKTNHSTVITAHQRIQRKLGEAVQVGLSVDGLTVQQLAEGLARRLREGSALG